MPTQFLSVVSGPATSASSRNLLEMQIPGPDLRPTESQALGGGAQLSVSTKLPSVLIYTDIWGSSAHQAAHLFPQIPLLLPYLCIEFLKCLSLFLLKSYLYANIQCETLLFPGCHPWSYLWWHYLVFLPGTEQFSNLYRHLMHLSYFPC